MQHRHRGVPLDDDGHTVGGCDHKRQPRVLGDQTVAIAGEAGVLHADHDVAVDLSNRRPRVGDAEGFRDAVSRERIVATVSVCGVTEALKAGLAVCGSGALHPALSRA